MKNKILIYLLIPSCIFLALLSCNEDKFLEVLPKGVVVAKTTTDFRKLLDDADNERYQYSLTQTAGMVDVLSDDVSLDSTNWDDWTSTRIHFQELFTFKEYVWLYDGLKDDNNWKMPYYIGSLISVMLTEIEKVTDNPELKAQLIAEAKVHRAYAYLALINGYAKAYDPTTASTDLGVPIVTEPAALPSLERNTIQEVYDFILKDLTEAVPDLPDDVDQYKHRPTKTAAYAILARTYLYMGDYEKALTNANNSLQIRDFLYDLNYEYDTTGYYKGTAYPYYTKINKISRTTDQEMLLNKTTIKGIRSYQYMFVDTTTFNQIYPGYSRNGAEYENYDLRRTLWFYGWNSTCTSKISNYAYNFRYYGNYPTYRYGIDGTKSDGAYNISVTTCEMYLTRAECNARLGYLQEALNDINTLALKRYRIGTYEEVTLASLGNSQEAVLDAVLKERRRELYGKELRLYDIKRLHIPMTHYLGSLKITVPADDPRFVLPIFYKYIETNPELEDNDRSISGVTYE